MFWRSLAKSLLVAFLSWGFVLYSLKSDNCQYIISGELKLVVCLFTWVKSHLPCVSLRRRLNTFHHRRWGQLVRVHYFDRLKVVRPISVCVSWVCCGLLWYLWSAINLTVATNLDLWKDLDRAIYNPRMGVDLTCLSRWAWFNQRACSLVFTGGETAASRLANEAAWGVATA